MDYEKLIDFRDSRNAFTREMGVRTVEIAQGYAKVELPVKPGHRNVHGSVHGGCLFTLADTVGGAAAASYGTYATTVNANINYLRPAVNGTLLTAQAREIKHGKNISVFNVEIRDEKDTLLAQGTFSYFNLDKEIEL